MSAKSGGSMATLLMSLPLAAIPLMAIFGIPQFAPVVASPEEDEVSLGEPVSRGRGREGRSYRRRAADLLEDYADSGDRSELRDAPPYDPADLGDQYDAGGREDLSNRGTALRAAEFESRSRRMPDPHAHDHRTAPRSERSAETSTRASAGSVSQQAPFAAGSAARFAETGGVADSAQPPLTWRAAALELEELGIQDYHLERGADAQSFLFVCSFTPGGSPQVTLRFEAEAQEPLAAVSNVLDQVNAWLRRRFAATQGSAAASGGRR